ncbi:MAG: metallophosphoesterase [Deltaproteobacteria bacterium]|nr:metallophosphoesterase [Deltaproteobacteria bacterium]
MTRVVSAVIFLAVILGLTVGLHWFLWARLVRDPGWGEPWSRALGWLFLGLGVLIPVALILGRFIDGPVARVLSWTAFGWMGAMFYLFLVVLLAEIVRWPLFLNAQDADRRAFFGRLLALVGGGGALVLSAAAVSQALRALHVKKIEVTLERLPPAFDGLRIAQLTDIHVGPTIRRAFVEEMVAKTNALTPDIIAITGDLMDGSVAQLREHVAPLADLKAKHGVFFVTGNHEYYSGVDEWIAEVQRLGIRVLRNERVAIGEGFELAGIDDYTAHQFGNGHGSDLPRALAGRDPAHELVLMAHQPRSAKEAASFGVGLQLSGHTHAGQIWPWRYAVKLQSPWVEGLYREGAMQLYVSPGTGYWGPPMRLGTQAEITEITLRSGMRTA